MTVTILVTGFGRFPGAPFNPTGPLVLRLARLRRPRLADIKIIPHVFSTSYAAVDRDLPMLLAKHRPHAVLMFGLASRTRVLRIELRARNAVRLLPDASGLVLPRQAISPGGPAIMPMPAPARRLLAAAGATRLPATLSHDSGRYLCNYLAWRVATAAAKIDGPQFAAFVHVPKVALVARRPGKRREFTHHDLTRAGMALLAAAADTGRCTLENRLS